MPHRTLWLLGSLSAFAVGLLAAVPVPAAAQDQTLRCTGAQEGFKALGATTCARSGGYLWAEGYANGYTDQPSGTAGTYGIGTLGLTLDTVTDTGRYGPLTGTVDIRLQYRTAEPYAPEAPDWQFDPQNIYLQWSGMTLGYRESLFDFYGNADIAGTDPATVGSYVRLVVAAYTLDLAEAWTVTLAAEDSGQRDAGIDPADGDSPQTYSQQTDIPDLVMAAAHDAPWGSAQLSTALHRVQASTPASFAGRADPDTLGYAVQAGVMIDLPQLAAGDTLYLQTAYANGATAYLGLIDPSGALTPPDAYLSQDGDLSTVSGWNLTAQYLHTWTGTLNSAVFAGYGSFDLNNALARSSYGASGGENLNIGANLSWSPKKNLQLIAQYIYNRYTARHFEDTGNGLPRASQIAQDLLLSAQYTF